MPEINLPNADRTITAYKLTGTPIPFEKHKASEFPRIAFAAAHVVADPLASNDPWLTPAIDWDTTLKFRHRLWDLGLGVAEAMDTAQRGMGLTWDDAKELIRRAQVEARTRDDAPWEYGLEAGAKGVQLAALGLQSWKERRWLDVPKLGI